jgi:hypothetical protein
MILPLILQVIKKAMIMIRTSLFGLLLYEIRPCMSMIKPVHDVVSVCLPLAWFNGGQARDMP